LSDTRITPSFTPIVDREIVGARRQSDVVNDHRTFAFRNDFPNFVLDHLEDALRGFDTRSGRGAQVELDLATVDQRKEVATDKRQHDSAEGKHHRGDNRQRETLAQQLPQKPNVILAHVLEATLEGRLQSGQATGGGSCRASMNALEEQADSNWCKRSRQAV
jgi:hypothetical protein